MMNHLRQGGRIGEKEVRRDTRTLLQELFLGFLHRFGSNSAGSVDSEEMEMAVGWKASVRFQRSGERTYEPGRDEQTDS